MEKSVKDLSNCLDSSTEFLQKIIDSGLLDDPKHGVLKMFIITQIESNKMTIRAYSI